MKIFDSQTKKIWSLRQDYSELPVKLAPKDFCSIKTSILSPKTLNIVAKKTSGNGWFLAEVVSEEGEAILSKKLKLSSKSSKEFCIDFGGLHKGDVHIRISRPKSSVGSIVVERVVILGHDVDSHKESHNFYKKKPKNTVDYIALTKEIVKRKTAAVIIPYGIYGGAEVYIERLISSGHELIDIDVICVSKNKIYENLKNTCVKVYKQNNTAALKNLIISKKYESIIFYNSKRVYNFLIDLKSKKAIDSKLIEVFHSKFVWSDSLAALKTRSLVDEVIRVSDGLANNVIGLEGVRKTTIPIPIDITSFDVEAASAGICDSQYSKTFGMVARLSPEKNIDYALDLFKRMPEYKLVILGSGPLRVSLEERIKRESINNVELLGYIKDPEPYYKAFNGFILTSKIEGTPISIAEAMAAGLPVVTTAVGEIPFNYSSAPGVSFLTNSLEKDVEIIRQLNLDSFDPSDSIDFILKNNDLDYCRDLFYTVLLNPHSFTCEAGEEFVLPGGYL